MGRRKEKGRGSPTNGNTWPESLPEWVKEGEGGEASRVTETTGGDCQGVGEGFESPRGTKTPGVEELPPGVQNIRSNP